MSFTLLVGKSVRPRSKPFSGGGHGVRWGQSGCKPIPDSWRGGPKAGFVSGVGALLAVGTLGLSVHPHCIAFPLVATSGRSIPESQTLSQLSSERREGGGAGRERVPL